MEINRRGAINIMHSHKRPAEILLKDVVSLSNILVVGCEILYLPQYISHSVMV